jgi:hypothetical protein
MGSHRWLKATAPWLLLFVMVVLPLYVISVVFALRSGLFHLNDRSISGDEFKALWAFIASGFATAASLVGWLLTRSSNERTSNQLALDTAVKGLELLVGSDGEYAPTARTAGSIAALVHLGHPIIAMRVLSSAWDEEAVDAATACWLISEVFQRGSQESMLEAALLLKAHARQLCKRNDRKGEFNWPSAIYDRWPLNIGLESRYLNFLSVIEVLLSRDRAWWGKKYEAFAISTMDLIVQHDKKLRSTAAIMLKPLLEAIGYQSGETTISRGTEFFKLEDVRKRVSKVKPGGLRALEITSRLDELRAWANKPLVDETGNDMPKADQRASFRPSAS